MKKKIKERRIEVMEERRQKLAKQSENREKRKEQLDLQLQEYGGLWRTQDEMKTNIDVLTAGKKKDALITQIKYRKFVLGSRPSEKSLLQLQHGKEKFTVEQLEENLESSRGSQKVLVYQNRLQLKKGMKEKKNYLLP